MSHGIFLVTHSGAPFLVVPTLHYASPKSPVSEFHGTLTVDQIDTGSTTITVTSFPGLFSTPTLSIPGLPPELVAHLRTLPGVWCVAVDPAGTVAAEWPAAQPGFGPEAVRSLFPSAGDHSAHAGSSYREALADGIFTAGASHSWPPGHPPASYQPSVPLAALVAGQVFARISAVPVPPAGAFFGEAAQAYVPKTPGEAAHLTARMDAAVAELRQVVIAGQGVGQGLLTVLSKGVSLGWAAEASPSATSYPAPPPCGWDMETRTIFLAPTLPPELDAAYLGAALYAAHGFQTGQSTVIRLLTPALLQPTSPALTAVDVATVLATEAARSWLLLAEIARTNPAATSTLSRYPWGPPALAALPPATLAGQEYASLITDAVARAATSLAPHLVAAATVLHAETLATRSRWFSPEARVNLPRPSSPPPPPSAPQAGGTPAPAFSGPVHVSSEVVVARPPGRSPTVLYNALASAPIYGDLMVHVPPGGTFTTATLMFDRDDGVKVYLSDVPADDVTALTNAGMVTIICMQPNDITSEPQTVRVKRI